MLYIVALVNISADVLQHAIARGVQEWRFFPRVAEILDIVRDCQRVPVSHRAAYERLKAAYDHA